MCYLLQGLNWLAEAGEYDPGIKPVLLFLFFGLCTAHFSPHYLPYVVFFDILSRVSHMSV